MWKEKDAIVHVKTEWIKKIFSYLSQCFLRPNYHTAYSWCLWLDFETSYVFISWRKDRIIASATASATFSLCLSPFSKGFELSAVGISCLLLEFSSRSVLFSVGFTTDRFSYHRVFFVSLPKRREYRNLKAQFRLNKGMGTKGAVRQNGMLANVCLHRSGALRQQYWCIHIVKK